MSDYMIPIPDAIRDDDEGKDRAFLFEPGPANIDLKERTMTAPVELSERTREMQLRELAHAKWSPVNMHIAGINQVILDAVEHNRLTHQLLNSGFDLQTRMYNDKDIEYAVERSDIGRACAMMVSTWNTPDGPLAQRLFKEKYGPLGDRVTAALSHFSNTQGHNLSWINSYTWENTATIAATIQKLLQNHVDNRKDLGDQPPPQTHPKQPTDEEIAASIVRDMAALDGGRYWSEMEIVEPEKPIAMPVELRARKTIKSDVGAVPIAIHRAMIDGRVFRSKRRKPGAGAVLIDQSGSMSMTTKDVERVMEHLPGVVIAGYATNGAQGELRILARNGKRVDTKDLIVRGGGNGCDGPALRWLETQPSPRFWVSDGHATALIEKRVPSEAMEKGVPSEAMVVPELRRELVGSQIRGRILRVENCSDLLLKLAKKAQRA